MLGCLAVHITMLPCPARHPCYPVYYPMSRGSYLRASLSLRPGLCRPAGEPTPWGQRAKHRDTAGPSRPKGGVIRSMIHGAIFGLRQCHYGSESTGRANLIGTGLKADSDHGRGGRYGARALPPHAFLARSALPRRVRRRRALRPIDPGPCIMIKRLCPSGTIKV